MPERVLAAVVDQPGTAPEVCQVELADLEPNEVRVRVAMTGVCHTDVAWADGEFAPDFPVVTGHESAGTVEAVGSSVTRVSPGDRVVLALAHHCGHCARCESGHPMLCSARLAARPRIFRDGRPLIQGFGTGGFAAATVVGEVSAVRVPDGVPLEVAAVAGCAVSTGLGAVMNIAHVEPGSSVAVFGCGGIGLSVVMGCAVIGATRVVAVDPDASRRQLALNVGATDATPPAVDVLRDLEPGGFDYVFECVGRTPVMEMAIPLARPGGHVVLIGATTPDATVTFRALDFVGNQKHIHGCLTGDIRPDIDMARYFALYLQGRLPLDTLVTGSLPLAQVAEAFDRSRRGDGIRTMVTMP